MKQTIVIAAVLLAAACSKGPDRSDTSATKADSAGMAGMNMAGMMSQASVDSMTAHMRMMDTASAASLQAMLPMHRQMVANMLSQMSADMRSMNMSGDARWTALSDSVRQDLVRLPEMNAQQLKGFMPSHHGRITRLMQSHMAMMKM